MRCIQSLGTDNVQPLLIAFQMRVFDIIELLLARDDVVLTAGLQQDVNPDLFRTMDLRNLVCLSRCPPATYGSGLRGKQLWVSCNLTVVVGRSDINGLHLQVHRDNMLEGLCGQLGIDMSGENSSAAARARHLAVVYQGENGAGDGVRREWLCKATDEIVDLRKALFVSKDGGRTIQPNPESQLAAGADHLSYFALLGRIAGFALYHREPIPAQWSTAFIKACFGFAIVPEDVRKMYLCMLCILRVCAFWVLGGVLAAYGGGWSSCAPYLGTATLLPQLCFQYRRRPWTLIFTKRRSNTWRIRPTLTGMASNWKTSA